MIELVMVIVILGILAATALPKFVDLGKDARVASLSGLEGSVRSAVAIVKSAYLVRQASPVTLSDGTTVTVSTDTTIAGLPTADKAGIGQAIELSADFKPTYSDSIVTFELREKCYVSYDSKGNISKVIDGC